MGLMSLPLIENLSLSQRFSEGYIETSREVVPISETPSDDPQGP